MSEFYERDGITIETIDPFKAASLEAQGFQKVDAPANVADLAEAVTKAEAKALDKMTLPELKEYAKAKGINLGDASRKDDVFNAIKAVEDTTPGSGPTVNPEQGVTVPGLPGEPGTTEGSASKDDDIL